MYRRLPAMPSTCNRIPDSACVGSLLHPQAHTLLAGWASMGQQRSGNRNAQQKGRRVMPQGDRGRLSRVLAALAMNKATCTALLSVVAHRRSAARQSLKHRRCKTGRTMQTIQKQTRIGMATSQWRQASVDVYKRKTHQPVARQRQARDVLCAQAPAMCAQAPTIALWCNIPSHVPVAFRMLWLRPAITPFVARAAVRCLHHQDFSSAGLQPRAVTCPQHLT